MVQTIPFSSVLHQLVASTSLPSSKGKGKARAQSSNFLLAPVDYENRHRWNESVEAFSNLVEKYKRDNNVDVDENGS